MVLSFPVEQKTSPSVMPRMERQKTNKCESTSYTIIFLMITLEKCVKILNNGQRKYSNDEVKLIRDYLYNMARLQIETDNIKTNLNF